MEMYMPLAQTTSADGYPASLHGKGACLYPHTFSNPRAHYCHSRDVFPIGTQFQQLAWGLVIPQVSEYLVLASTLPEREHERIVPRFRGRLTLADVVVVAHIQGLKGTAEFVRIVDPCQYPRHCRCRDRSGSAPVARRRVGRDRKAALRETGL